MKFDDYLNYFITRYDLNPLNKYLLPENLNGLKITKFSFLNDHDNNLEGRIYEYQNTHQNKLIVFVHGLTSGHISYMNEINELCKRGYKVLTYDMTGVNLSEGESIKAFSEGIACLAKCLEYIKDNSELNNLEINLVGHSLGSYSAMNILNYYDNITKVVAISGFISVKTLCEYASDSKDELQKVLDYEKSINRNYYNSSALEALEHTNAKVLVIHSTDDDVVPYNISTKVLLDNIKNPNVKFHVTNLKYHKPYLSFEAAKYNKKINSDIEELKKNNLKDDIIRYMSNIDYNLKNQEDSNIWDLIESHLES